MGNLKQKYTSDEWDELVDSTKPGFVEKRINQAIHEAAEKYASISFHKQDLYDGFVEGAKWMMENVKINLRR
jgi:hypothetical protein